MEPRTSRLY